MRVWGVEGQLKLKSSTALVVGLGGLGSAAALYLAHAGVGRLILVDGDAVSLSDLSRQVLYSSEDVGRLKVDAARGRLESANPGVEVECYPAELDESLGRRLVTRADVVVDALDNWPSRLLLNELCVELERPLVHAAAEGFWGQATTVAPGRGPCLHCIFRRAARLPPTPTGVVATTPGVLGLVEATEAVKLLLKLGELLVGRLLLVNLLECKFEVVEVHRDPSCPICKYRS